jgi:hypothetical protein
VDAANQLGESSPDQLTPISVGAEPDVNSWPPM